MVLDYRASSSSSHGVNRIGMWRDWCGDTFGLRTSLWASILSWVLSEALAWWGKWAFFLLPGMVVRVQEMICCDKWQWLQVMWEDGDSHMGIISVVWWLLLAEQALIQAIGDTCCRRWLVHNSCKKVGCRVWAQPLLLEKGALSCENFVLETEWSLSHTLLCT